MNLMAVGNGLYGSITYVGVLRREEIPNAENDRVEDDNSAYEYSTWSFVCPLWENLSHKR
jgi:hypothetical protein